MLKKILTFIGAIVVLFVVLIAIVTCASTNTPVANQPVATPTSAPSEPTQKVLGYGDQVKIQEPNPDGSLGNVNMTIVSSTSYSTLPVATDMQAETSAQGQKFVVLKVHMNGKGNYVHDNFSATDNVGNAIDSTSFNLVGDDSILNLDTTVDGGYTGDIVLIVAQSTTIVHAVYSIAGMPVANWTLTVK